MKVTVWKGFSSSLGSPSVLPCSNYGVKGGVEEGAQDDENRKEAMSLSQVCNTFERTGVYHTLSFHFRKEIRKK